MTKEGLHVSETDLGRGVKREKATEELVTFDNPGDIEGMTEAFLSDSPHAGKKFDPFIAHTLIAANKLHTIARNLHRFPKESHQEIIDSLSESPEGKTALGIE